MADVREPQDVSAAVPYAYRPNIAGLLWAMVFAAVAIVGFSGSFGWIFAGATQWVLAGGVALVGLILLVTALPHRPRN
ncbi:MAG: hypothetical protein M3Z00_10915 [Actinomycetota bacterium]|nr:hypothetical protein [Actinomycetota bacterium]